MISSALKCSMDVQSIDGQVMLLRYLKGTKGCGNKKLWELKVANIFSRLSQLLIFLAIRNFYIYIVNKTQENFILPVAIRNFLFLQLLVLLRYVSSISPSLEILNKLIVR